MSAPGSRAIAAAKANSSRPMRDPLDRASARILAGIAARYPGISVQAQCQRVLEALTLLPGGLTPLECRAHFCIANPGEIVRQLRLAGLTIHSEPCRYFDAEGNERDTVVYTMASDE